MRLYKGDCLELMDNIPEGSVDMILCDLPYGTTNCAWDALIPFAPLWAQYKRIIKPCGTIALFSAQPFTTRLIHSNMANYKYSWYWKKNNVTNGPNAKVQPMRCIEDINIFRFDEQKYNNTGLFPLTREYLQNERKNSGRSLKELQLLLGSFMTSHYFTNGRQFTLPTKDAYSKLQTTGAFQMPYNELVQLYESEQPEREKITFTYNPQGVRKLTRPITHRKDNTEGVYKRRGTGTYTQQYTGYPHHLLTFDNDGFSGRRYHPTQKPVALLEYLIKTYTNEGETVLDNTMGSGSTGVACVNTGRHFIGIEMDDHYFEVASQRIKEAQGIERPQVANDAAAAAEQMTLY